MRAPNGTNGHSTNGDTNDHQDRIAATHLTRPFACSGSLDAFDYPELTPVIGREYTNIHIQDLLDNSESSHKIRDLAVTISLRAVVVLRGQHDLDPGHMRDLIEQLSY